MWYQKEFEDEFCIIIELSQGRATMSDAVRFSVGRVRLKEAHCVTDPAQHAHNLASIT